MSPTLFAVIIFDIGSHFLRRPAWTVILLFVFHADARVTGAPTTPNFFCLVWSYELLLPSLA
jgi:hypothetical protein